MEPVKRIPDTSVLPLDELWAKEAEDRLASYQRGEIKALPLDDVLSRYKTDGGQSMSAQFPTSLKPPPMR